MTREETLEYRRSVPYDAMGDYSILFEDKRKKKDIVSGMEIQTTSIQIAAKK